MTKAYASFELSEMYVFGAIAVGASLLWDHTNNDGKVLAILKKPFSEFHEFLVGDKKTVADEQSIKPNELLKQQIQTAKRREAWMVMEVQTRNLTILLLLQIILTTLTKSFRQNL